MKYSVRFTRPTNIQFSYPTVGLLIIVIASFFYGTFLFLQNLQLPAYADTITGIPTVPRSIDVGHFDYSAPYSSGQKYVCKGNEIWDGNNNKKEVSCGDSGQACYALDNQIEQMTQATCITNGTGQCSVQNATASASSIASCKFYRHDQTAESPNGCPPSNDGFRCDIALDFKSSTLLSYIDEVAKNTGVPAAVLAGVLRIESTVPQAYSATGKSYSISDYTDDDIKQMEAAAPGADENLLKNQTIGNNKAYCPYSSANAIGIMQVLPTHDMIPDIVTGHNLNSPATLQQGASFLHKYYSGLYANDVSPDNLSLKELCDPKTSLYLGAGIILAKMNGWNPPSDTTSSAYQNYVRTVYGRYNGISDADAATNPFTGDLWQSVSNCTPSSSGTASQTQQCSPAPGTGGPPSGAQTDCLIPNGAVSCGSRTNPVVSNDGSSQCGHCGIGYPTGSSQCALFFDGTSSAIDVAYNLYDPFANDGKPIYLPKIAGHDITYTLVHKEGIGLEQIEGYSGVDSVDGKNYYLQLHHTQPDSGAAIGTVKHSGDVAANICSGACNEHHVHLQLQTGSDLGAGSWLDATQYFCRNNTQYTHYQH